MEASDAYNYSFTALRGIQAGREYYVAMCPLKLLPRLFLFDEEELAPQLRAQRTLNRARVPEIARYIIDNPSHYVFSSITVSVDGKVDFVPASTGNGSNVGRLAIPMTARFIINDGQHRRAAIEEALRLKPELADETISVVLFLDAGLLRSQQMFADLNRHAVRPTRSIGILYDHRDALSKLALQLTKDVPAFRGLTELEKTTISNRSRKLFTLSSIYLATQRLLRKSPHAPLTQPEAELAKDFWTEVGKYMPDWQAASERTVATAELRRDYIHAHGVALQALAIAGADLIAAEPARWKLRLKGLAKLDWLRSNAELWEGRATIGGRVSKSEANVQLTANVIKSVLGLQLSAKETKVETRHGKARRPH
jgi:DNA sulfur modification protein DndB